MPLFQVRRRVDAYVDYVANVRAATPQDAASIACDDEGRFRWEEEGPCEFDARLFITLDENGDEIEDTQCGDF